MRLARCAHRRVARTGPRRRTPDRARTDESRQHHHPRAVQRRRDFKGCAAGRDGVAGVGRRRLHAGRASARSSTCDRSRSRSTSTRATSTASKPIRAYGDRSMRIPTGRFPRASSRRCRPRTARRRPCWSASRFEELDPRILPDMGVKVTFLRDAEERWQRRQARRRSDASRTTCDARAEGRDQDRRRSELCFVVVAAASSTAAR